MAEVVELSDDGAVRRPQIEGFIPEVNYFNDEERRLIQLAAVGPGWDDEAFQVNWGNIRRSFESRIKHADEIKRKFVLDRLGYSESQDILPLIPEDLAQGVLELIPKDEDPERGRLITFTGNSFSFGPVEEGNYVSVGASKDLDGWPLRESAVRIDEKSSDSIQYIVGQTHSHTNFRVAWDWLKSKGKVDGDLPEGTRIYSPVPSLPDIINHIIEPELVLGIIVTADRNFALVLRPGRYLDHFREYYEMPNEELEEFMTREINGAFGTAMEEERALAKEFADKVGLKLYYGRVTDNDEFLVEKAG
mgnify:FL=1